ncbi:MAG: GAF domain-containing protein [Flavobacteriaceae bacterium]
MNSALNAKLFNQLKQQLQNNKVGVKSGLKLICELLNKEVTTYDWVGFYFADFEKQLLHLKAYSGAPTIHTTIPFGKGICGQVALSNATFLVPDVSQQENYIACSATVRSELVVPLFVEGKNIGQIDIDSETPDAFSEADELFLTSICELVALTYGKLLIQL